MSFNNINTKLRQDRGFTIVELLIVIVVIGILAAITIVSFNGVTARANRASAQSAAETVLKKAEAYNAEKNNYPLLGTDLTGAAATDSWFVPSTTQILTADPTTTTGKTGVRMIKCSATNIVQASITASNITGVKVTYYDFTDGTLDTLTAGNAAFCSAT